MSSSVYSVRFISNFAISCFGEYTVPEGYRAIVRDADSWHEAGGTGADYIYLSVTSIGGAFWYQTFDDSNWVSWRGRQVINEGEQLVAQGNSEVPMSVMVSGYLLTLP